MKTPEEIIQEASDDYWDPDSWDPTSITGKAVIEALDAAGYVIVPKEPTEGMLTANPVWSKLHTSDIWRAMIAAKP